MILRRNGFDSRYPKVLLMDSIIKQIDYDCNGFEDILRKLCEKYPFLKSGSIGKSVLGRDIKLLRLGKGADYILYTAAIHGSERLTATVLLRFIEELCEAVKVGGKVAGVDARRALYGKGIMFVPVCNPDGCEIALKGAKGCGDLAPRLYKLCGGDFSHWNANARGVDLNHNFDAGWDELHQLEREHGFYGPGPTRFGGLKPHSEPETAALVDLCLKVNIRYVMCFHSQGEVIYWDYGGINTHRGHKMAEIFAASSGYALDVPTTLAVGGGFKDWFIERFSRPGFTIELGKGKNPLPPTDGEKIYSQVREMMMLGLLM